MISWTEKKTYYYGALYDDSEIPIKWKKAASLYDAVMAAKKLVPRSEVEQVEIQTKPKDPPIGTRIPPYRIGCVIHIGREYIFMLYTTRSFNIFPYSKDYLIKGTRIIERK